MTEDGDKWRKYVHSVAKLGSRTAKKQNRHSVVQFNHRDNIHVVTGDWKSQNWKTWDQIAGVEKAGLENAGTSYAWVSKCNIINVRGHVRVNVTAGRGDLRTLQEATVNATAATANETDNCKVCLVAQREPRLALVPCGHQRFCESCIRHVESIGSRCPICRADIRMVFRQFQHLLFDMYCISADCTTL